MWNLDEIFEKLPGFGLFRILIQKNPLIFRKYFGPSKEFFWFEKKSEANFYIWMSKKTLSATYISSNITISQEKMENQTFLWSL